MLEPLRMWSLGSRVALGQLYDEATSKLHGDARNQNGCYPYKEGEIPSPSDGKLHSCWLYPSHRFELLKTDDNPLYTTNLEVLAYKMHERYLMRLDSFTA